MEPGTLQLGRRERALADEIQDSSPFVKAKRAIKRGSYSQWTW